MKALIVFAGYILGHATQAAQYRYTLQHLPWEKMRILIYFIYAFSMTIFIPFAINDSQASVSDAILNQKKAVVTIYVTDQGNGNSVTGSGFIIDRNGIVVTNYELISSQLNNNGNSIFVRTYTKGYYVVESILAFDEQSDLAILKIAASDLPVTSLAVKYQPRQGEQVVVIGRPLGSGTTVTEGNIKNILGKKKLFEISADILPGNSGSPVFNSKGEVIGVATILSISGESVNFAVPVSLIENLLRNPEKKSAFEDSAQKNRSNDALKSRPIQSQANTAELKRSMPSDWLFFSMSEDQDTDLFYSPKSLRTLGNKRELLIKWIYLNPQGPSYSNSQKILKLSLGEDNYKLSYGIGTFIFDCDSRIGTETKEIYFDSKGTVILAYVPSPLVSSYFTPETVYGYLLDIICKRR
jgi:S1-C subfamily serine protease